MPKTIYMVLQGVWGCEHAFWVFAGCISQEMPPPFGEILGAFRRKCPPPFGAAVGGYGNVGGVIFPGKGVDLHYMPEEHQFFHSSTGQHCFTPSQSCFYMIFVFKLEALFYFWVKLPLMLDFCMFFWLPGRECFGGSGLVTSFALPRGELYSVFGFSWCF